MPARHALILLVTLILAGCASGSSYEEGRKMIEAGQVEEGLAQVAEAVRLAPADAQVRAYYVRQRDLAVFRALAVADSARAAGRYDEAARAYARVLAIDAGNARARAGQDSLDAERRHRALLADAEALFPRDPAAAHAKARVILAEDPANRGALALARRVDERSARAALETPQLDAALRRPVTLEFREANLRAVLEIVARHGGLNFVYDRDVRPDLRASIAVRNTPIEEAIRLLLVSNQLERKVLNENTLLIYPATPAKAREYRELMVKVFYLTNADVKQTANMLRALVKTRDLYVDEKLNLLVMRDTPEAVRVAERLVASQDLGEPEVLLEVEILEVGTTLLQDLGVQWPSQLAYSLVGGSTTTIDSNGNPVTTPGTPGSFSLPEWQNRDSSLVRLTVTDPLVIVNLRKQDGRTNILANPRIRVKNRDKAKVHIGDKVPVVTTTTTSTGFVAESVSYLETGLKLEVEPNIHLDSDVAIKIGLEVSSITREVRSVTGTITYQVGTRNAATVLRLKDGETQMLAGLISDEERKTVDKVPGLGDLPFIGRLFGSTNDTANKTEIVLLITPRVVRNLTRPEARLEEFLSGTEAGIGVGALAPAGPPFAALGTPPLAGAAPAAARFALQAPAQVAPGQEFTVQLGLESAAALRSGSVAVAFDATRLRFLRAEPAELLAAAGGEAALRASAVAPGRLALAIDGKADVQGSGALARLVFAAAPDSGGAVEFRLEALAFSDASGRPLPVQALAPASLAIAR